MNSLFDELRRRNVFRVGATYAVVGWVAIFAATAAKGSETLFQDMSATHLPQPPLNVQSKDARPVDIDGDGDLDILIAHEYRPNVLLLNEGGGRFSNQSAARLPQFNRDSEDIAAGDFDGDADMDIVFVSEDDEENEFYLNDGKGYFADAGDRLPTRGVTNGIATADINGDGLADLVFGDAGRNAVLIADAKGGFRNETELRMPDLSDATQDVEFGDVDGDGDLDLLVANEGANRLLINDGSGKFNDESEARLQYRDVGEETREADFGDIDGDGDLDIYFANVNFRRSGSPADRLLVNDGNGYFTDESSARLPQRNDYTMDADFVDIDGDGDVDILTAGLEINKGLAPLPYRVFVNDGAGLFEEKTVDFLASDIVGVGTDIEAADFNADGRLDLYLANRAGPDFLLFGRKSMPPQ